MKPKIKKLLKNKKVRIGLIIAAIFIAFLMIKGCHQPETIIYTTLPNGSIITTTVGGSSGGGGGGGGGGSTTPSDTGTDTGDDSGWWTWPAWDFFGFDIPNPLDDINWPDFPSTDSDDTEEESFDTRTVLIDNSECTRSAECQNLCSNPVYAKCSGGKCSCSMPEEVEEDLRDVSATLKCTRDDSCDYMCAAANSGDCVNGKCGCITPEIIPTFDTRTVLEEEDECSRDSDCDYKCAAADSGDCNSGVCGCITPPPTITCSDSDYNSRLGSSIVFDVQGTCSVTGSRSVSDYCSGDNLIEYSCSGTYCRTTTKDCSEVDIGYTCSSGKCVLGR